MTTHYYSYNNLAGCLLQTRHEITGVLLGIYHAGQANIDAGNFPWVTICEQHHTIGAHRTQALAKKALVLVEWCEICQSTDKMKFAQAIVSLRQAAYQAQFLIGKNRAHALRLANSWSCIGRHGVFFSTGDQGSCFNEKGSLIAPIEWYWEGDCHLILKALKEAGLTNVSATRTEKPERGFSVLVVTPDLKET